jgi:hypothetical protein
MAKKTTKQADERSAYTIAIELKEIRDELNTLKLAEKATADELKTRMKAGEDQDLFRFLPVTSLKISDLTKAMKWAKKFAPGAITVNTTAARRIFLTDALTGKLGTPEKAGFVLVETEQLREIKVGQQESGYDIAE